jgi:hypothetical protein
MAPAPARQFCSPGPRDGTSINSIATPWGSITFEIETNLVLEELEEILTQAGGTLDDVVSIFSLHLDLLTTIRSSRPRLGALARHRRHGQPRGPLVLASRERPSVYG